MSSTLSKMPPVFRECPPLDLVNSLLQTIGLSGIDDYSQFSKQSIHTTKFEEMLPLLEPYYLPCKANDYLYKTPFTNTNVLTILRQVLKAHGATLKYIEKSSLGTKQTFYQIKIEAGSPLADLTIAFE